MVNVTVVMRNDTKLSPNETKHIHTYFSSTIPRVDEFIEIKGRATYLVTRVIHQISDGSPTIIVEVKSL